MLQVACRSLVTLGLEPDTYEHLDEAQADSNMAGIQAALGTVRREADSTAALRVAAGQHDELARNWGVADAAG